MTNDRAYNILETMAVDMTGALVDMTTKDPMWDVLKQRLEAINEAQDALCAQSNNNNPDYDYAVKLLARLLWLCSPNREDEPKLFKRIPLKPGKYMGSGYPFVDAFHKIYNEYCKTVSEDLHQRIGRELYKLRKEEEI